MTLYDPQHFSAADYWGGFGVALIILFTALHVVRDTSNDLMDAMPGQQRIDCIRSVALSEPGVKGVEKIYARKTGLQYPVELHLEVEPSDDGSCFSRSRHKSEVLDSRKTRLGRRCGRPRRTGGS
jgi:divalent metal cation (Fe/Co/Zn/Cd) transporter